MRQQPADGREDDATWTTVETEPGRGATSVVSAGTVVSVDVVRRTQAGGPSVAGMTAALVGAQASAVAVTAMTGVGARVTALIVIGTTGVVVAGVTALIVVAMNDARVAGVVRGGSGTTGRGASRAPVTRSCPRTPMPACSTAA